MSGQSEADRLRECRLRFERACNDRITMHEAADRLARERWAEAEQRLSVRREERGARVGEERTEQWWQR